MKECDKVRHGSRSAAREAHRTAGFRVRVYWHRECAAWHVSNEDKAPQRRRRLPEEARFVERERIERREFREELETS